MCGGLLQQIDQLMTQLREMGVQITPGMPVPDDEEHQRMAANMLSLMVSAHKAGRHTAFCRCALRRNR